MKKPLFTLLFGVASVSAYAEQVITLVEGDSTKTSALPYLKAEEWEDRGYIRARAVVDNPGTATCISPTTTKALDNLFSEKKLDIVVTASTYGFPNMDSSREIPVATYSWNGTQYCKSAFQPPVLLVPYTPLRKRDDPLAREQGQPGVVLRVRSSAQEKERISDYANAMVAIAGEFATGGAAQTVSGLSTHLSGPTFKYLSGFLNTNSTTDQTLPIKIKWADLVAGKVNSVSVSLKQTKVKTNWGVSTETITEAINRLSQKNEGIAVLTIRIDFDIRRSMLVGDERLTTGKHLPPNNVIETFSDNILNFPKVKPADQISGLTLNQLLNTASPSPVTVIGQAKDDVTRNSACTQLINSLRDTFAVHVDAPIFLDATLRTVDPKWSSKRALSEACSVGPQFRQVIKDYLGDQNYFPVLGVLPNPELPQSIKLLLAGEQESFLNQLRVAFLTNGPNRANKFKDLLTEIAPKPEWPKELPPEMKTHQLFSELATYKAGCLFAFEGDEELNFGMVVITKESDLIRPHVIVLRPESKASGKVHPIAWIGLKDLTTDPQSLQYLQMINAIDFEKASICSKSVENRSAEQLLAQLSKAP